MNPLGIQLNSPPLWLNPAKWQKMDGWNESGDASQQSFFCLFPGSNFYFWVISEPKPVSFTVLQQDYGIISHQVGFVFFSSMGLDLKLHLSLWESIFLNLVLCIFLVRFKFSGVFSDAGQTRKPKILFHMWGNMAHGDYTSCNNEYFTSTEIMLMQFLKKKKKKKKGLSFYSSLTHCTTHIRTQRQPYVWQVKWGLGRGEGGWAVSGAHSCFSSNIHLGELSRLSLSDADQLLLGRWSGETTVHLM